MINNIKLKAKIIESGYSVDEFAPTVGMCATTLRKKMRGEQDFKLGETIDVKKRLKLSTNEYIGIFFGDELEL